MPEAEPQYLDDDHAAIAAFAEAYLEEDERPDFVDSLLERRGYTRVQSWAPPEPQGGQGQGRRPLVRPQRPGAPSGGGRGRAPYFKR